MAGRNKGSSSKEVLKSQVANNLPPPPPSPPLIALGLIPLPNLKKKRKEQDMEEGELVPLKGAKQQETAKDKCAFFADSREDLNGAKVCT